MSGIAASALGLAVALASLSVAGAQTPEAAAPQRMDLAKRAEERLHTDWADFAHYASANAALPAADPKAPRVVFMGDSITEFWKVRDPGFFERPGYVDRGVSGQTTPQMLVRFRADVVALKPRVVHIMGGANDVAGNTGPESLETIEAMIASMVEIAKANRIRVVLASVPPAADFSWRKGLQPGPKIVALNAWLKAYAAREGLVYADYFTALTDGADGMRGEYSKDGVHPTPAGYAVMDPIAAAAIAKALR